MTLSFPNICQKQGRRFQNKDKESLLTGFPLVDVGDGLMFLSFEIVPHLGPKVSQSLLMKEDLSFELHAHEVEVPFSTVQHILPNEKIENVDDVLVGKYKSSPAL